MLRIFSIVIMMLYLGWPTRLLAYGERVATCSISSAKPSFRIDIYKSANPIGDYQYMADGFRFHGQILGLFECKTPFLDGTLMKLRRSKNTYRFHREYMRGCFVNIEMSENLRAGILWVDEYKRGNTSKYARATCTLEVSD